MNHPSTHMLIHRLRMLPLLLVLPALLYSQTSEKKVTLRQGAFLTEEEGRQELRAFSKTYTNKVEWENRADNIRQNILIGTELAPLPEKCPLRPIIHSKRAHDGYTVENVAFESLPGFFVTGNLYRPTKTLASSAAILCPHGHFFPTTDDPGGRLRKDMQLRCAAFARMGAIVFAYDMVGWGESTQFEKYQFPASHDSLKKEVKYQLWNSIRAVDFLLTLEGVDPKRIGITGASGGGTQTFLLAAVDQRIAVSVPVVMVACHFFGGCICESGMPIHQSPRHLTDNAEIAALVAPKPMLLVSDGDDWTKNNPQVEFPYIKSIYSLYGASDNVENVHLPNDKHDYGLTKRIPVYRFMAKHLLLDLSAILDARGEIDESPITIENKEEMLVFTPKHPRPAYAIKAIDKLD